MLNVLGKPILEHIILHAKDYGFYKFVISTYFLSKSIMDYFGNGEKLSVNISYIEEDKPLGTAGSLGNLKLRNNELVVIANGDVLTQVNYQELLQFHIEKNNPATIGARYFEMKNPFGVIESKNGILTNITEKPTYSSMINAGIYIIDNRVHNLVKTGEFLNITDLLLKAKNKGMRVSIFPIYEPWLDVGQKKELEQARKNFLGE